MRHIVRFRVGCLSFIACWLAVALSAAAQPAVQQENLSEASGRDLMDAVYSRHRRYPYVYEEQSMVLVDRHGRRETRRLTRYSRVEADGSVRILLRFTDPRELLGMALLATLYPDGSSQRKVFLPALGQQLISNNALAGNTRDAAGEQFLGTDFSIENLTGESLEHYRYKRRRDALMEQVEFYVIDVFDRTADPAAALPRRRHYVLKDGLFITRTDHFSANGRVESRQTHHDLVVVNADTWRANMMLMNNLRDVHQTIIKIDRRIFSPDYVPEEVFTADWIFANAPQPSAPQTVDENPADPAESPDATSDAEAGT